MSYTERLYAALILDELEDYESVIEELSKHIDSGAPGGAALHNRAVARWEIGQYEQAAADFDRAHAQLPSSHMPLQMKGVMLQQLGNLNEALRAMDSAVALAPNEVTLVRTRAYARLEAGLLNEALEDFNHAVQLAPDFQTTRDERDRLAKRIGGASEGGAA